MPPASPGETVGDYELLAELGRGGMGVVFRARDRRLGREVALKTPWPRYAADPRQRLRFLREARAGSCITHPGVVPIHEAFEVDGQPWIALQLVDGEDLRTTLDRGTPPLPTALRWGEEIASALEAAHAHHVLHRDVNPRNILVTRDGRALLADFGLARVLVTPEEASGLSTDPMSVTAHGGVLGTPRYMSPEQALGREVDVRTDIFSLGAVLWEIVSGKPAFAGESYGEILDRVVHRDPEPLSRVARDVPPELDRIVAKCLRKDPDDRYPDARALGVALRSLRRDLELEEHSRERGWGPGTPPSWSSRLGRWGAAAALAAVVVLAIVRPGATPGQSPFPPGTPHRVTPGSAWDHEPAMSPDGSRIAFTSDRGGQLDLWIVGANGGRPLRLTDDPSADHSPAWFPDGTSLAFVSDRGGTASVWKIDQAGGDPVPMIADAVDPAISPDGLRVAFARADGTGYDRIRVARLDDLAGSRELTGAQAGRFHHRHPAWTPDGRALVYADFDRLWVVPLDGPPRPFLPVGSLATDPCVAPGGDVVVYAAKRGGIGALWCADLPGRGGLARRVLRRLRGGGRVGDAGPVRLSLGVGGEGHPSYSADGRSLAFSTGEGTMRVAILDRGSGRETILPGDGESRMPALFPDGSAVVYIAEREGGTGDLWLQPLRDGAADGPARRLTRQTGTASQPVVSPDGRYIAYYRILDETRSLWVVPTAGGAPQPLEVGEAGGAQPAWAPDGRAIAFVAELPEGTVLRTVPIAAGRAAGAVSAVDGAPERAFAPSWGTGDAGIAIVARGDESSEVWIVRPGAPARRVTHGADALRVRWDDDGRTLWVCGRWGGDTVECRAIDAATGRPRESATDRPIVLDPNAVSTYFDVSSGGRFVTFSRWTPRGAIWALAPDA